MGMKFANMKFPLRRYSNGGDLLIRNNKFVYNGNKVEPMQLISPNSYPISNNDVAFDSYNYNINEQEIEYYNEKPDNLKPDNLNGNCNEHYERAQTRDNFRRMENDEMMSGKNKFTVKNARPHHKGPVIVNMEGRKVDDGSDNSLEKSDKNRISNAQRGLKLLRRFFKFQKRSPLTDMEYQLIEREINEPGSIPLREINHPIRELLETIKAGNFDGLREMIFAYYGANVNEVDRDLEHGFWLLDRLSEELNKFDPILDQPMKAAIFAAFPP
ncbi:uncharacterized protein ASCRUDRAFT_7249 [Ascoidea rubescens DSM 1968]|uniref:Uncharacterized protein n=1 Tax=Ascoidea rubescens DSM 1968 TaxID=1344418 RepID=A0A1D2VJG9_9ASCO|nr:hypothetical protein ASCRUDRAFT_7249 [Ascoidea rubescens DSM 1968]ODV61759.1 hypothetical protein ASCRUDRAFT_7249 [Ascoidea rubescens DSM 1968]